MSSRYNWMFGNVVHFSENTKILILHFGKILCILIIMTCHKNVTKYEKSFERPHNHVYMDFHKNAHIIPVFSIQLINWIRPTFLSTWKFIYRTALRPRRNNVSDFFVVVLHHAKIFVDIFTYKRTQMLHKVSRLNSFPRVLMKPLFQKLQHIKMTNTKDLLIERMYCSKCISQRIFYRPNDKGAVSFFCLFLTVFIIWVWCLTFVSRPF